MKQMLSRKSGGEMPKSGASAALVALSRAASASRSQNRSIETHVELVGTIPGRKATSSSSKTRDGRTCNRDVLFDASAARSDSADNYAIELDGNSAAKYYYSGVVGRVQPEALLARLR